MSESSFAAPPEPAHGIRQRLITSFGVRPKMVAAIALSGLGGGVLGALYLTGLDLIQGRLGPGHWSAEAHLAVLVITGVAVAVIVQRVGPPANVELLVDNIHVPGTSVDPRARLRSLIPISLLCIGAGGTLGPEAPLVTMTGTLSDRHATRAGLDRGDIRIITITGMAAGFAVLFGAPLAGAVFALEIPHRRGIGYHEAAIPACFGAIIGHACSTAAGHMGLEPIWKVPVVNELGWIDLPWAIVAGVLGAVIAIAFTASTRLLAAGARRIPLAARPVVGGVLLGSLALASPYALTNGELQLDAFMGTLGVAALLGAAVAKLAGAAVCVATGWQGGFIIPLFFVGFCVGKVLAPHLPGVEPWPFILAVMIAANVGVTKTPLGSALAVTEMSGTAMLPTALVASLCALVLTSPVTVIHSQRDRVDVYGGRHERAR